MHITDTQIATYKEQGFLIVENFLTEEERQAALDGIYTLYSPPFDRYVRSNRKNDTPGERVFPWDHAGLNHVTIHPDLVDVAERILETREIRLGEGHLGIKYAGEDHPTGLHIDYSDNTLGPLIEPDDFMHLAGFYCFEDVEPGMAPIMMVPNGRPDDEAVPMLVPGGSVCLYSIFTRHSASDFTAKQGARPTMWVGFNRKDRPWDGGRTFTYKSGAAARPGPAAAQGIERFIREANSRQLELLGFPPPGDALWTEKYTTAMATRYAGFNRAPYDAAR